MNTMNKMTLRDVDLTGKKILMRVDFNVPQFEDGSVKDDKRIREALNTIRFVCDMGGKLILCSHLGRPDGVRNMKYSLQPIARKLQELLDKHVTLAPDCIGKEVEKMIGKMKDGEIVLLENVRFYKEETDNDAGFAKKLASLADVYVNDAFGAAHRAHASTEGVAKYLPAVCGFLMEKEIKIMGEALVAPKRPLVVMLGGAKVVDKIGVIDNLLNIANAILIGGGMMFTFIKAMGGKIGKSLVDESNVEYCKGVIAKAKQKGVKLVIAEDCLSMNEFKTGAKSQACASNNVPEGWMGLDIGEKSIKTFKSILKTAGTVIWNGPLGVIEFDECCKGTKEIAEYILETDAIGIICGGDTGYAVAKFGIEQKFAHVSTGGGASLELLEGKQLPGIVALNNRQ